MPISEQAFREELDGYLKRIGGEYSKKAKRNKHIADLLGSPRGAWDDVLELVRKKAINSETENAKAANIPLESSEQKQFVAWFKDTYPITDIMMIRNDGTRTGAEKTEQLLMGLLPGAADLFIPDWLCWVEIKRSKKSLTEWKEKQQGFAARRSVAGQTYLLCYGCEDAKLQINEFLKEV